MSLIRPLARGAGMAVSTRVPPFLFAAFNLVVGCAQLAPPRLAAAFAA